MSVPNPFDPYRLQGCYGIPTEVVPSMPWWRSRLDRNGHLGWVRIDGPGRDCDYIADMRVFGSTVDGEGNDDPAVLQALRDCDETAPLRRPAVLPGQVWAAMARGDQQWHLCTVATGRMLRQDFVRTDFQTAGKVLVYGPGAPWAPPEWAPGKVWDGSKWTRAEEGQQ